jgi:hypothetical protein
VSEAGLSSGPRLTSSSNLTLAVPSTTSATTPRCPARFLRAGFHFTPRSVQIVAATSAGNTLTSAPGSTIGVPRVDAGGTRGSRDGSLSAITLEPPEPLTRGAG